MKRTYVILHCVKKSKTCIRVLKSLIELHLGIVCEKQFYIFPNEVNGVFYIISDQTSSDEIVGFLGYMFIADVVGQRQIELDQLFKDVDWLNLDLSKQGELF